MSHFIYSGSVVYMREIKSLMYTSRRWRKVIFWLLVVGMIFQFMLGTMDSYGCGGIGLSLL